jgi:hypothetical protein
MLPVARPPTANPLLQLDPKKSVVVPARSHQAATGMLVLNEDDDDDDESDAEDEEETSSGDED